MTILEWKNLEIGYNKKSLVKPFSGKISDPGLYVIVGQNGCGKSTLLKSWLGLIPAHKGQIKLLDKSLPYRHDISEGIAYVPQFHTVNQYFHISVYDFIKQGFGPNCILNENDKARITELLDNWQLSGTIQKSFHELSGGQKVRCMLVRAIVSNPKILFFDEPLASLDICCQRQLMETIKELVEIKKVCVIMVDHHLESYSKYIQGRFQFYKHHDDVYSTIQSNT